MTVYAAGALCWREVDGQLLVAIIHRKRYNDWSWPKGKVDPGESLPQAAVREIREETGLKVKLGVFLGVQKYMLANGADKEVHYWAAKVTDKALANNTFKPDEEVEKVEWKTPDELTDLLSYEHDKELLQQLRELHAAHLIETKPFIVLRHGKAVSRSQWDKSEGKRPLQPQGRKQSLALVPVLSAYGVKSIISSPWTRCIETVKPFSVKKDIKIDERAPLSEQGHHEKPAQVAKLVESLVAAGRSTVVCSHRPVLPTILNTLAKNASKSQKAQIEAALALEPGQLLIIHLTKGEGSKRRIAGLEIQSPNID